MNAGISPTPSQICRSGSSHSPAETRLAGCSQRAGGIVVVAARRRDALESLAAECRRLGGRALPFALDYSAEIVAEAIERVAEHPVREAIVGRPSRALLLQQTVAPALNERLMAYVTDRRHFDWDGVVAASPGNLFTPSPSPAATSGGWRDVQPHREQRAARSRCGP